MWYPPEFTWSRTVPKISLVGKECDSQKIMTVTWTHALALLIFKLRHKAQIHGIIRPKWFGLYIPQATDILSYSHTEPTISMARCQLEKHHTGEGMPGHGRYNSEELRNQLPGTDRSKAAALEFSIIHKIRKMLNWLILLSSIWLPLPKLTWFQLI